MKQKSKTSKLAGIKKLLAKALATILILQVLMPFGMLQVKANDAEYGDYMTAFLEIIRLNPHLGRHVVQPDRSAAIIFADYIFADVFGDGMPELIAWNNWVDPYGSVLEIWTFDGAARRILRTNWSINFGGPSRLLVAESGELWLFNYELNTGDKVMRRFEEQNNQLVLADTLRSSLVWLPGGARSYEFSLNGSLISEQEFYQQVLDVLNPQARLLTKNDEGFPRPDQVWDSDVLTFFRELWLYVEASWAEAWENSLREWARNAPSLWAFDMYVQSIGIGYPIVDGAPSVYIYGPTDREGDTVTIWKWNVKDGMTGPEFLNWRIASEIIDNNVVDGFSLHGHIMERRSMEEAANRMIGIWNEHQAANP